jgi:hypothetical protein
MATAADWSRLLTRARVRGTYAGVSSRLYPSDPRTLFGFQRALRAIPDRPPRPRPLPLGTVTAFLEEHSEVLRSP